MSRVEVDESLTAAARFHLQDIDGAGARYSPVFSTEFRETVFSLLSVAARACAAAKEGLTLSFSGGCAMRVTQRHPADKHVLGYLTLAVLILHLFGWG